MKKVPFAAILAISSTATFAQTIAPKSQTYTFPGTAALYYKGARVNTTAYEFADQCLGDANKFLAAERLKDATTKNLTAYCMPTTFITNELVPAAVVLVTPPVVPIVNPPVVAMTPGYGKLPANPRQNAGSGTFNSGTTSEQPAYPTDGSGDFRTRCAPSHVAFDDPIVYPGQPGRSHLHQFFGNTGTSAASTTASIAGTGNSTCRGGIANRSAYWVPAMIDMRTSEVVAPDDSDFYYKTSYRGVVNASIKPLPAGLRMIAGDPKNTTDLGLWGASPYVFKCHNNGAVQSTSIIPNCPVGDQLELSLNFPQCWDGKNLDSPDHKSHMAYANGGCPASHPVALPEVSFHILWPIKVAGEAANWRLSSDTYTGPAGRSAHGDYIYGWVDEVAATWATRCIAAGRDCHSHLWGDGRTQN